MSSLHECASAELSAVRSKLFLHKDEASVETYYAIISSSAINATAGTESVEGEKSAVARNERFSAGT